MGPATSLALRAIVSGLHYAGTIDQRHVAAIVDALGDAADKAKSSHGPGAEYQLRELAAAIARDGQISGHR